jgi:GNAT superfamily N-acetyltransferase
MLVSGASCESHMPSLMVSLTATPNDAVRLLIGELEEILSATLDGAPAGCDGVALFDDFAEVKRMHVRRAARGLGVARAILDRIEAETRVANLARLCLENGDKQAEAPPPVSALRVHRRPAFRRLRGSAAPHALREYFS